MSISEYLREIVVAVLQNFETFYLSGKGSRKFRVIILRSIIKNRRGFIKDRAVLIPLIFPVPCYFYIATQKPMIHEYFS
jgi:hypothetical protein